MVTKQEWQTVKTDGLSMLGYDDANTGLKIAQVFTLGTVGDNFTFDISSVQMALGKTGNPTGNMTFKIYLVQPDNTPIDDVTEISANTSAFDVSLLGAVKWQKIPMDSATLVKGGTYCLVAAYDNGSAGNTVNVSGKAAGGYGGGEVWETKNGAAWTKEAGEDFAFVINGGDFTGTMCTLAEAVDKAGALASAISTNEIIANTSVLESESYINSATKYNWIDVYSTLNADVQKILNETTACLAAIKMAAYNFAGYSDNEEVELMINIYREIIERNIEILKDLDVQKWFEDGATN